MPPNPPSLVDANHSCKILDPPLTMYRFCLLDGLNGPKTSTATLSKAPSTGNGKSGALLVFLGDFFIAQSTHDLHQCSTSLNMPDHQYRCFNFCALQNGHRRHDYVHWTKLRTSLTEEQVEKNYHDHVLATIEMTQ